MCTGFFLLFLQKKKKAKKRIIKSNPHWIKTKIVNLPCQSQSKTTEKKLWLLLLFINQITVNIRAHPIQSLVFPIPTPFIVHMWTISNFFFLKWRTRQIIETWTSVPCVCVSHATCTITCAPNVHVCVWSPMLFYAKLHHRRNFVCLSLVYEYDVVCN